MSCRWGELLVVLVFRGQEPGMLKTLKVVQCTGQ